MQRNNYLIVAGYASTFNNIDKNNHVVLPFAFYDLNHKTPIFLEHNSQKHVGHLLLAKMDLYGLYVEAVIYRSNLIKKNMSVGIKVLQSKLRNGILFIEKAKLLEVSLTNNPVNELCVIDFCEEFLVGDSGLEPPTSTMST